MYTAASAGKNATLSRSFASGTKVVFTYAADPEDAGHGEIWWNLHRRQNIATYL